MKHFYRFLPFLFFTGLLIAQPPAKKSFNIHTVAFYNVENLFDTINDPNTFDDDRTPKGRDRWTTKIYNKKVSSMAKVIAGIGKEATQSSPTLVGLSEVENRKVVEDLIADPQLRASNYGIVHFDSPDERGIDVALLFKKNHFVPTSFYNHPLYLYNDNGKRDYTRDQLLVTGFLDGEEIHIIVNHWPSRSGGQARSEPKRIKAAELNKKIIDSLLKQNRKAKIIDMGDFNDTPSDASIKKTLQTAADRKKTKRKQLYNPMEAMEKKGLGTSAYRDSWFLLDQIFVSGSLLQKNPSSWYFWKAGIYNPSYLINSKGRYKGYPYRSFAGSYLGGYSDHFPVYVYLLREVQ